MHWLLVYVNIDEKTIYVLDSLPNFVNKDARRKYSQGIFKWLVDYFNEEGIKSDATDYCVIVESSIPIMG